MKTLSADSAERGTWLVFRLGHYVLCASALDVEGIIQRPPRITKLPLTPEHELGAFLFRGRTALAISLRRKLRLADGEDRASNPFIIARIGDGLTGFWVDEVKDVIQEKDAEWRPMPSMFEGGLFERFAIRENQLILQTSFAALRRVQVEFESLAAWVTTQADTNVTVREATDEADLLAKAASGGDATSGSEAAPPAAPIEVREVDLQAPAATRPPHHGAAVAPKPRIHQESPPYGPSRARLSTAQRTIVRPAPQARNRVAPEKASQPPAMEASPTIIVAEATPRRARSSFAAGRFVIALIAMGVTAAFLYLPLPTHDRHANLLAAISTRPSAQDSIAPASIAVGEVAARQTPVPSPDPTVPIEHGTGAAVDPAAPAPAKAVGDIAGAAADATRVHTVVRGDTLWQIAKNQVGDPFRYSELAKLSNIRDPNLIRPGDIVRIEIRTQK